MDTIKILLGMTVALLVGALAMSWKNFREDVRATPKKELAEVQRQIAEIEQQRKLLQEEKDRLMLGAPSEPKASPSEEMPIIPEMAAQDVPETGAVFGGDILAEEPVPDVLDGSAKVDPEVRAKAIAAAPVVATIKDWAEDPQYGTFVTIQVRDTGAVKAEAVLCVRRGSGILGRVKVGEVDGAEALVNPVALFGDVKPKAGDELIVEP